jgi:hypothetical protein
MMVSARSARCGALVHVCVRESARRAPARQSTDGAAAARAVMAQWKAPRGDVCVVRRARAWQARSSEKRTKGIGSDRRRRFGRTRGATCARHARYDDKPDPVGRFMSAQAWIRTEGRVWAEYHRDGEIRAVDVERVVAWWRAAEESACEAGGENGRQTVSGLRG